MISEVMVKIRKTSLQEDGAGVFDWNEIDAEIEQENQDRTERVAAQSGEESDRSYSPAPCNDRSSEDIEDAGHSILVKIMVLSSS